MWIVDVAIIPPCSKFSYFRFLCSLISRLQGQQFPFLLAVYWCSQQILLSRFNHEAPETRLGCPGQLSSLPSGCLLLSRWPLWHNAFAWLIFSGWPFYLIDFFRMIIQFSPLTSILRAASLPLEARVMTVEGTFLLFPAFHPIIAHLPRVTVWNLAPILNPKLQKDSNVPKMLCQVQKFSNF